MVWSQVGSPGAHMPRYTCTSMACMNMVCNGLYYIYIYIDPYFVVNTVGFAYVYLYICVCVFDIDLVIYNDKTIYIYICVYFIVLVYIYTRVFSNLLWICSIEHYFCMAFLFPTSLPIDGLYLGCSHVCMIRSNDWCQATSSTAQGGGGSFKNRQPTGEIDCCESGMAERIHWWTERCLRSPLFLSLSLTIYLPTYTEWHGTPQIDR